MLLPLHIVENCLPLFLYFALHCRVSEGGLVFDSFAERCHHFVDRVLAFFFFDQHLNDWRHLHRLVLDIAVLLHDLGVFCCDLRCECFLFLLKLFLELRSERLELTLDDLEQICLLLCDLLVECSDGGLEATTSRIKGLLQRHLDVHKVALELLDGGNQRLLVLCVVDGHVLLVRLHAFLVDFAK